jgi:hypothetical protein
MTRVEQRAARRIREQDGIEWEHVILVPLIFSKYGQEKSFKYYVVLIQKTKPA